LDKSSISENIAEFRKTKNPLLLVKALFLTIRQGRFPELINGVYCSLFFKPSDVKETVDSGLVQSLVNEVNSLTEKRFFTRDILLEDFGDEFYIQGLPQDFSGCRTESFVRIGNLLIIGEYRLVKDSATIAVITEKDCIINDFYNDIPTVRHIHSIHKYTPSEILISTGDNSKYTDLWTVDGTELRFKKRIKKRLAGYTGCAEVNNTHYFGTDFSGRPNYIETLKGRRYFFPSKAYKMYVSNFFPLSNRYIASINTELPVLGGREALSIFDTVEEQFIYCEYFESIDNV
jgi:hypothetical protein